MHLKIRKKLNLKTDLIYLMEILDQVNLVYNAFYWCPYDKIYITDGWVKKPQKRNLINFSELYNLKKDKNTDMSK